MRALNAASGSKVLGVAKAAPWMLPSRPPAAARYPNENQLYTPTTEDRSLASSAFSNSPRGRSRPTAGRPRAVPGPISASRAYGTELFPVPASRCMVPAMAWSNAPRVSTSLAPCSRAAFKRSLATWGPQAST